MNKLEKGEEEMMHEQKEPAPQTQPWQSSEVVESWRQETQQRQQLMEEATQRLLDAAALKPGDHVLDIAAGTGDQSLLAARRVGSRGTVLATDLSEAMLKVAEQVAQQAGVTNIATRVMDAEHLTLEDQSFDAVICRQGLMLVPHLKLALTEILRVLKPGGKLAAQVWSAPEHNPLLSLPLTIMAKYTGGSPFSAPGPFALGDPAIFEQALTQAGFRDVSIQAVPLHFQAASAEAFIPTRRRLFADALERLSQEDQQRLLEEVRQALQPFEGPHGLVASGEVLIGAGTRIRER
jgi:ubiquinone/menaquinone biosynthesis C-methylase UbiE